MKIGILSDAHANMDGLELCLDYLLEREEVSRIYFLGDFVGYLRFPNAVIDRIRNSDIICLGGNHDDMVCIGAKVSEEKNSAILLDRTCSIITEENREFLSSLEPILYERIGDVKICFSHGNPLQPLDGYLYEDGDFEPLMEGDSHFYFMGHTHRPFTKKIKQTTFVNVGSCGLPRDNGSYACCVTFETKSKEIIHHRIKMDIEKIITKNNPLHPTVIDCFERVDQNLFGNIVQF